MTNFQKGKHDVCTNLLLKTIDYKTIVYWNLSGVYLINHTLIYFVVLFLYKKHQLYFYSSKSVFVGNILVCKQGASIETIVSLTIFDWLSG